MARRSISIQEKIEKQKSVVFALKDKYDAALQELHDLEKKERELQSKELLEAFSKSEKSYEEIMAFLKNENQEKDD